MVPFNNTGRIFNAFKNELSMAILKSAESGFWLMGEQTKLFEQSFAHYCGASYCVTLANGTDALEIALRALLDNQSDSEVEVITVANAGGYSSTACRLVGVTPVYADIEVNTHLVDIESIIRCLSKKTKVVIVTHLYGGVVDVEKIRKRLNENNYQDVKILEDCAQAHGGMLNNAKVGSMGDIGAFSFYPTKNLGAMGDAGALVTSSTELFEIASSLKQYGWSKKYEISRINAKNSRIDEIQAGILNVLLPQLDNFNEKRKSIFREYVEASDNNKIRFLDYSQCDFVAHLAVARVNNRDDFISFMKKSGICVDVHYPILDINQPAWVNEKFRIDEETKLEISIHQVCDLVSFPLFPFMYKEEIEQVVSSIKEWCEI